MADCCVPFSVPSGVLHTPGFAGQTLNQLRDRRGTARDKSPEALAAPTSSRDKIAGQRGTLLSRKPQKARDSCQ